MDVQLQDLIDKIKNDGVLSAEENAKKIISEAETKASQIIQDAQKKADNLKEKSLKDAEITKQSSIDAVKQSARDLVIDLNKEVQEIFTKLIKSSTTTALKGNELSVAINTVLSNWDKEKASDLSILLPEAEKENVLKSINSKFSDLVKSGLEIKPHKSLEAGFKISEKGGNVYYDFSAEGVGQMMAEYLSPGLAQFVKDVKES